MLSVLIAFVLSAPAPMDMQSLNELSGIRQQMEAIQVLEKANYPIKSTELTEEALKRAKLQAPFRSGETPTYEAIVKVTGGDQKSRTAWDKMKGFCTFINLIYVTAAIMLVSAIIWLFGIYLIELMLLIPKEIWEGLLYIGCFLAIGASYRIPPEYQMFLCFPAALGLVGCLQFSGWVHKTENLQGACWFLTVTWGTIALIFGSPLIGFIAVGAFLGALGFVCGMTPHVIWIGFDKDDYVPRTTIAAGILTALYILMSITGTTDPKYVVFREGLAFMGPFVYFLGLLIWSSKWYHRGVFDGYRYRYFTPKYWLMQAITVASGVAALALGSIYGLNLLLGVGGTLFYIYLIEKYYEVPWKGAGWAWSLLGLAGILYAFAIFAQTYPKYFLFMIW